MPNLDLKGRDFKIDNPSIKQLLNDKDSISYEYMKKIKSELDNKDNKDSNDEKILKWINHNLDSARKKVDGVKRTIMQTDGHGKKEGGNAYKDTHNKDKDNADPTGIRIPKVHKGKTSRQIMSNKISYESIESEIDSIRYLIEYMDNNKTKQNL